MGNDVAHVCAKEHGEAEGDGCGVGCLVLVCEGAKTSVSQRNA